MKEKEEKKKKIVYIIRIIFTLLVIIFLLWPKPEYVSITFDTKGGTPVEDVAVRKGKTITLPETKKTGYTFAGWYWNDKKIKGNKLKTIENKHLIAKWVLSPSTEVKPIIFEISFETDGGSSIGKISLECGKGLVLPNAPEKEKYIFRGWKDRYGTRVYDGDLLACENQTLTATWEKKIEYICPDGYTLSGDKCNTTKEPERKCKKEELDIGEKKCLADYKEESKCGSKTVLYQDGRVEKAEGEFFEEDGICYYGVEENYTEELCNNVFGEGHYQMDKCFEESGEIVNDCPVNHIYFTEEQLLRKTGLEEVTAGCYEIKGLTSFCDKEYELDKEKDICIKTINATVKE